MGARCRKCPGRGAPRITRVGRRTVILRAVGEDRCYGGSRLERSARFPTASGLAIELTGCATFIATISLASVVTTVLSGGNRMATVWSTTRGMCASSCAATRWRTPVSYTHLRAHETDSYLVCRLLLEKKK